MKNSPDYFPKDLEEALSRAPSPRDNVVTSGWHRARVASVHHGQTDRERFFLQLRVQLVGPEHRGALIGHKLWLTEAALSISKDMLRGYGLPLKLNELPKLSDFSALPECWIYIASQVRDGRRRVQIENVVQFREGDVEGPSDDRI